MTRAYSIPQNTLKPHNIPSHETAEESWNLLAFKTGTNLKGQEFIALCHCPCPKSK